MCMSLRVLLVVFTIPPSLFKGVSYEPGTFVFLYFFFIFFCIYNVSPAAQWSETVKWLFKLEVFPLR